MLWLKLVKYELVSVCDIITVLCVFLTLSTRLMWLHEGQSQRLYEYNNQYNAGMCSCNLELYFFLPVTFPNSRGRQRNTVHVKS